MREHWGKLGEIVLKIGVKLKLQELGLSKLELVGKKASWLPYRMPNSNAIMGLIQFNKLDRFNAHRFEIAKMYSDGIQSAEIQKPVWSHVLENGNPTWIRYPIVVKNGDALRKKAEQSGIFLGNWYTEVIHCKDVDMGCMLYTRGSCPKAEKLVKGIVNLPTHIGITENEVEKILRFLNEKS